MADKGIYTIITAAAMLLRFDATYGPRLINCWLPAETWVDTSRRLDTLMFLSALTKTDTLMSLNINTQKFDAAFAKSLSTLTPKI